MTSTTPGLTRSAAGQSNGPGRPGTELRVERWDGRELMARCRYVAGHTHREIAGQNSTPAQVWRCAPDPRADAEQTPRTEGHGAPRPRFWEVFSADPRLVTLLCEGLLGGRFVELRPFVAAAIASLAESGDVAAIQLASALSPLRRSPVEMVDSVVAGPAFRPAIVDRSTLAGWVSVRRGLVTTIRQEAQP